MRRSVVLLAVCLAACRVPPPGGAANGDAVSRGISFCPYEGGFGEYPAVSTAADSLETLVGKAEETLEERLGFRPDPERSISIGFVDVLARTRIETRVVEGRRVCEVSLPAAALAQGQISADALVLDAMCRAALSDEGLAPLPGWYTEGAPLWVSGGIERAVRAAVLGGPRVRTDAARIAEGGELLTGRADPLACGLFLRFLAEEFGAERVVDLFEGLRRAGSPEAGLAAVLDTDAAALPVAYDSYRLRVVSELTDDRLVRELAAAQALPPRERSTRLTGLSARTGDPWVAAAIEEELALALFEAEDFKGAAETLARIERDHSRHALHADRDRFHFALCFARSGEPEAAALRLDAFLTEFPGSGLRTAAEFEQAGLLLELGRASDAISLYRSVARAGKTNPFAAASHKVLAAFELGRFRYDAARRHLEAVRGDAETDLQITELQAELARGLPEGGRQAVSSALAAAETAEGSAFDEAVETIAGVGPAASPVLLARLAERPPVPVRRAILLSVGEWSPAEAEEVLFRLLADEDEAIASGAVGVLLDRGVAPSDLRVLLDRHPDPVPLAKAEWQRRFGAAPDRADVAAGVSSKDAVERREAARLFADVPGPEALSALLALLRDAAPPVRSAAVESLALRPEPEAREGVLRGLGDEEWTVRVAATGALFARRDLDPLRETALFDTDPQVRLKAAQYLLSAGEADDVSRLLPLLGDPDGALANAVEAMLRTAPERAVLPAAERALRTVGEHGAAMRLVRVIAAHAGSDFGYDPSGGPAERARVADALAEWLARQPPGE